jgi:streptogramin lyase
MVWVSDWGANRNFALRSQDGEIRIFPMRQLAGRHGEVWGAESSADKLFVLRTE